MSTSFGSNGPKAAEEDQQVVAGDDRGRVELQAADRLHERVDVVSRDRIGACSAKSLASHRQPPGMFDPELPTPEIYPVAGSTE
jgi:hypothetical protein